MLIGMAKPAINVLMPFTKKIVTVAALATVQ